ncbi:uncharacterized protein EHS24_001608 [Apiotrichum porosum]|uniref:Uncharacterized protein n=1 Tax=Apiotrichum porosum TaxID=105984 RepID=A0A427XIJ4_9TREE|nr:uncharacterized protein EHS24_001608 [Apiotrichum porosum]RSH78711.1 hypothetical protein EHS24_001608 [Apiotrichum porosum]
MPPPIPPPIQPPIQPPIPPTTNLSTNEISRSLVYLRRTRQRLLVGPHAVLHLPHSTHISGGAKNIQYFALSLWDHTFGQTWEMGLSYVELLFALLLRHPYLTNIQHPGAQQPAGPQVVGGRMTTFKRKLSL